MSSQEQEVFTIPPAVISEITLALSEVLTGNADEAAALIEAIAAGKIPHVSINLCMERK